MFQAATYSVAWSDFCCGQNEIFYMCTWQCSINLDSSRS